MQAIYGIHMVKLNQKRNNIHTLHYANEKFQHIRVIHMHYGYEKPSTHPGIVLYRFSRRIEHLWCTKGIEERNTGLVYCETGI